MPAPIRAAIVGLDHWYTAIELAENFAGHPDIELVGIADANADHAREVAAKAGVARVTTDLHELVDDPDIELVVNLTIPAAHAELAMRALSAGKSVYNEKPIGVTPPNFVELEITETEPGFKGDTSGGTTKPAKCSTGLEIQVPLLINQHEIVKIDTRTGEYAERAKK